MVYIACHVHSLQPETRTNLSTLVRIPLKTWTKRGDTRRVHEALSYHSDAGVAFANFKTTMTQPKTAVNTQLDQSRKAAVETNISVIKCVAKAIHLCGKQGKLLRGHREDGSTEASGNKGSSHALSQYAIWKQGTQC